MSALLVVGILVSLSINESYARTPVVDELIETNDVASTRR